MDSYGGNAYGTGPYGGARRNPFGEVTDETTVLPATAEATATVSGAAVGRVVIPDHIVTVEEWQVLEVVLTAVRHYLDDGTPGAKAEDAVQLYSVADTLDAQARATRPSRKVIGWALDQIRQFPVGFLSGLAANHFTELLHAMHG